MDISRPGAGEASASLPPTMKVMSCPTTDKALTNKAYCSINDAAYFLPAPGLEDGMVYVKNTIVLTVSPDAAVADGYLALNAIQRKFVRVSLHDDVQVARYMPENGSSLVKLTVDLHFVKYRGQQETLDAERLKPELTSQYCGQIMAVGQSVVFKYNGTSYMFTVKEAIRAGEEAEESNVGLWTQDTHLILETPGQSGITIILSPPDSI